MQLRSQIRIRRDPEAVWKYLGDHRNVPVWDRGVGSVRESVETKPGVGFEFSTFGKEDRGDPGGAKMSYRIAQADYDHGCTVELTNTDGNARFFKRAEWNFKVVPDPDGAVVLCTASFTLRFWYLFMGPILFFSKNAIYRDLKCLKEAIESESTSTESGR